THGYRGRWFVRLQRPRAGRHISPRLHQAGFVPVSLQRSSVHEGRCRRGRQLMDTQDKIDRSRFLECMAWCGTGVVYGLTSAGLVGRPFGGADIAAAADISGATSTFVQISDTHIGFHGEANGDVVGTFQAAIDKINALPRKPDFVMHTGDLSHLSKPAEFDTVKQMLGTIRAGAFFSAAGEHDVINDQGKMYFSMFEAGSTTPWYSFDAAGVHALALTNVINIKAGGILGRDQLDWAKRDLALQKQNMPIVVFAHIPLAAGDQGLGWAADGFPLMTSAT